MSPRRSLRRGSSACTREDPDFLENILDGQYVLNVAGAPAISCVYSGPAHEADPPFHHQNYKRCLGHNTSSRPRGLIVLPHDHRRGGTRYTGVPNRTPQLTHHIEQLIVRHGSRTGHGKNLRMNYTGATWAGTWHALQAAVGATVQHTEGSYAGARLTARAIMGSAGCNGGANGTG
ncbi:hypothetical protein BKA93DRAFT_318757 [Sparassis latifolia]